MSSAPVVPVLPESAPFSASQRAWLNGFFAGLMGSAAATPAVTATPTSAAEPPAEEESFPWHDPALPIGDRLKLADGKPKARLLMAAMAQLDCGSCGYDCKTYAEAIDGGSESDLTKCSPGGSETARKLKELVKLTITAAAPAAPATAARAAAPAKPAAKPGAAFDRNNPYPALLVHNKRLNGPGSAKDTRHIVFSLAGSGLTYAAGDALGIYPENCSDTVERLLTRLDATGAEQVPGRESAYETISLFEALSRHYNINKPTPALFAVLADTANAEDAKSLRELADSENEDDAALEVLDLLDRFHSATPTPAAFVGALGALRPRLYSISSSPHAHPDEVHLTVGVVRYRNPAGRECHGVASTCLADRLRLGQRLRVFVQSSHFRPPVNDDAPMIMVGPGTGVAPFLAFLQERHARGAKGRNWLFFGDQKESCDFLYRDELERHRQGGVLTRLDTAFSRDSAQKVYVQHRMIEHGAEFFRWLQDGGCFYVCGDAKRMASDVDAALKQVVAEHGRMSPEDAAKYVAEMSKTKRYQRDVY